MAAAQDVPFLFVEGNAELTPARLVGHFDPARVLADGYAEEIFVDGPLVAALRSGGLLYVEELNRVPEETLNVLITVMCEGELHVPRLGRVAAAPGFRLVAAMNPFDAVGTARISAAVYDRTCRIAMGYQSAPDEQPIVVRQAPGRARRVASPGRRPRPPHPRAPRRPDRVVGARRDRPGPDRRRRWPRPAAAPSPTGTSAWTRRSSRCRDGSGWPSRARAAAEDVVRELYEAVFGAEPTELGRRRRRSERR